LTLPLQLNFEHALIALEGAVLIGSQLLVPGNLGYLPIGFDEARLEVLEPSRIILLGGVPFPEPILMWWNFVARSRTEIDAAFASWKSPDGRFGEVASSLLRIETPAPFWQKG
jgi:redox-sensitive bicupin YhaK (pirin superfamily)